MSSRPRSPMARPMSFVWTRRIVLTLLGLFAALPVYVMLSTSLKPLQDVTLVIHRKDGSAQKVTVTLRVDSPIEVEYLKHGGILPYVLRNLLAA